MHHAAVAPIAIATPTTVTVWGHVWMLPMNSAISVAAPLYSHAEQAAASPRLRAR
jgi:hypothetical protein